MSILGWVVLGLVSGFIASKLINNKGTNLLVDVILGMVGALVGGLLFMEADTLGITVVNVYSIIVAMFGSLIILFMYHRVLKH